MRIKAGNKRAVAGLALGAVTFVALAACDLTGTDSLASAVEVTVRIDEQPAADVAVNLYPFGGTTPLRQSTTAPDGKVLMENLAPGEYEISVVVPDSIPLAGGQPQRAPFSVFGGQTATLLFRLTAESEDNIVVVHLTDSFTFEPADVTIAPGTAVRWYNDVAETNTITPDGHTEWQKATLRQAGEAFTHTFDNVGVFPYFSDTHVQEGMRGTITVVAPAR